MRIVKNAAYCCFASMKLFTRRNTTFALAVVLGVSAVTAQTPTTSDALPPHVARVGDVLVPVASEIFATLDKFKDSNWRGIQRPELAGARPRGDQASVALLLGAVIAEGFIAVEAEDSAEMKNLGRSLLTLSRGLGVEQWALKRSRSIVDHAEAGDWKAVREEWDHVLPDVQEGMNELKSEQLAQLVSLGGWLRGTAALAALVTQRFSPENAELLRQPALTSALDQQAGTIGGEIGGAEAIGKMREGMQRIRELSASGAPLSVEQVKQINTTCEDLIKYLAGKATAANVVSTKKL